MIISISPYPSKIFISFKKEDYVEDDFKVILNSLVQYKCSYTITKLDDIIDSVKELLAKDVVGIALEVFNDMNINVYGVTSIEDSVTV